MATLHYLKIPTPDGLFFIIIDEKNRAIASGFGSLIALIARLPLSLQDDNLEPIHHHPYETFIHQYFLGDANALTRIPCQLSGTSLQQSLWRAIQQITYGSTKTYQELASIINHPKATRAVGTACGANRLILIVPCHRVIKSDGTIGSYLYGTDTKLSLLYRETTLR